MARPSSVDRSPGGRRGRNRHVRAGRRSRDVLLLDAALASTDGRGEGERTRIARELHAQAYEPVRSAQTLESLDRQRSLLSAADALEKRAREILEWPIDEGTWARVITIATSVTAITVARLILDPLGL